MKVNKYIPVHFQKIDFSESVDNRFMKVKIWLMHLEDNYNGSYFSEESVKEAIPTLDLTPILGFIEVNDETGEEDFSDHRYSLSVEDGELKWKYKGHAYGVIPPAPLNNAQFEKRIGDDGVERTYLTVEGWMWTKFEDAINIISRDGGFKSQSMELSDKYAGEWQDDGLFHFSKFQFNGACILGTGVLPAMNNASVEMSFTGSSLQEEIKEMMKEFSLIFSQKPKEVHKMKFAEVLAKYSVTESQLAERGIVLANFATAEELDSKLSEEIVKMYAESIANYESIGNSLKNTKTKLDEATVQLDNTKTELEAVKATVEQYRAELDSTKESLTSVEAERDEVTASLNEYKRNEHVNKAEEIISKFTSEFKTLEDADVTDIRENIHEYSIEDIEEKLYARQGRKVAQAFQKNDESTLVKFNLNNNKSTKTNSQQAEFADVIALHAGN